MKANELRIGNWIFLHNKEKSISAELFKIMLVSTDDHALKSYRPIPLTEEWLLKFGYEKDMGIFAEGVFHSPVVSHDIDYDGGIFTYRMYNETLKDVKYVHELQNLYFALTGEELNLQP